MSAADDPRIKFLRDAATACARGVSPEAWWTFCLIIVHPSARVIHRQVVSQGGAVIRDSGGVAMMLGEISKLQDFGIPAGDGRCFALLCAGLTNVCVPIDLVDDEEAARLGANILGVRK